MFSWLDTKKSITVLGGARDCGKTTVAVALSLYAGPGATLKFTDAPGSKRELDQTLAETLQTANGIVFVYRGTDAHWSEEETFLKQLAQSATVVDRKLPIFVFFSRDFVAGAQMPAHPLTALSQKESQNVIFFAGSLLPEVIVEKIKFYSL